MTSRGCKRSPDEFCYICGEFIKLRSKKFAIKKYSTTCYAYKAYFGMPIGDQDKNWAPHVTCLHCTRTLEGKVLHLF